MSAPPRAWKRNLTDFRAAPDAIDREWTRLKLHVNREETLRKLTTLRKPTPPTSATYYSSLQSSAALPLTPPSAKEVFSRLKTASQSEAAWEHPARPPGPR